MTRLLNDAEVQLTEQKLRLAVEAAELDLVVTAMNRGGAAKVLPRLAERLHRDVEALGAHHKRYRLRPLVKLFDVPTGGAGSGMVC